MSKNWPFKVLLVLFLAPFCAALIILHYSDYSKFSTVENGTLLQPPIAINSSPSAKNTWQILYLSPTPCLADCIEQKNILRNLHIALGANQSRVQLTNMENSASNLPYKDGTILIVDPNDLAILVYSAEDNLRGLLKDLKRLLKYSHV